MLNLAVVLEIIQRARSSSLLIATNTLHDKRSYCTFFSDLSRLVMEGVVPQTMSSSASGSGTADNVSQCILNHTTGMDSGIPRIARFMD